MTLILCFYRVGDYVYFENSASGVYAIRRIEELNKNPNGEIYRYTDAYLRIAMASSNIELQNSYPYSFILNEV